MVWVQKDNCASKIGALLSRLKPYAVFQVFDLNMPTWASHGPDASEQKSLVDDKGKNLVWETSCSEAWARLNA